MARVTRLARVTRTTHTARTHHRVPVSGSTRVESRRLVGRQRLVAHHLHRPPPSPGDALPPLVHVAVREEFGLGPLVRATGHQETARVLAQRLVAVAHGQPLDVEDQDLRVTAQPGMTYQTVGTLRIAANGRDNMRKHRSWTPDPLVVKALGAVRQTPPGAALYAFPDAHTERDDAITIAQRQRATPPPNRRQHDRANCLGHPAHLLEPTRSAPPQHPAGDRVRRQAEQAQKRVRDDEPVRADPPLPLVDEGRGTVAVEVAEVAATDRLRPTISNTGEATRAPAQSRTLSPAILTLSARVA